MTFFSEFSPNDLKPFFFGGIASCVAEAITFPIDTAKTRLQLQGMSYSAWDWHIYIYVRRQKSGHVNPYFSKISAV